MRMTMILKCVGLCVGLGLILCVAKAGRANPSSGTEYHVSMGGNDTNDGSVARPLRTISAAARLAQPGDTITVHQGTYRERVNPPRGGTSDDARIVYRAAPGEKAVIKGSEVVKRWQKVQNDTWKAVVSNSLFGDFNPYSDLIHGDWFNPLNRQHHTGVVYLNGHWLIEAVSLEDVLKPVGAVASSYVPGSQQYLLNVAWLSPGEGADAARRTPAARFASQHGVQTASCSEGGECIGWIEQGDWVRYEQVDFGRDARRMEIRAASATTGGTIEIRLDTPEGELLGACAVPNTGDWQSWRSFVAEIKPTSGVKTLCLVFRAPQMQDSSGVRLWFAQVDASNTTIWAQFKDVNPNEAEVEINVRQSVFYPEKTGVNYITVRGFTMVHAATPWAPPTAEQIGLIGANWSKGWLIEDNDIRYSICTGVTLGKHGDEFDNTSQDTAEGYVLTIERGLKRGWSKDNIGGHIVRNNRISHCEQSGIVGILGPIFCTVTGNTIHDIHVRCLFTGAEMAGIKFHGAIDTVIEGNHIFRTCLGIWLDWMAQGTRVTGNLLHDNGRDLFTEVNHGPFLVDNNFMLSGHGVLVNSQGGAYVHNLIAGTVQVIHTEGRRTPYHKPHSTEVVGLHPNPSGDDRYYNNIFVNAGLTAYDEAKLPVFMAGNVFLNGAKPSRHEPDALVQPDVNPNLEWAERSDGAYLQISLDKAWAQRQRRVVTTELLGKTDAAKLPYEQADGSPYRIDRDYLGRTRDSANPFPGPIEPLAGDKQTRKVWPVVSSR
ncbi:MAG TPA: carbohydrate-binding protein [Sedimentisphaerales bacterium]|nr:carbohydrate-binding protein [Sedimentisphaerales bacterium]HNU28984.1 carbohydrate-binding protein [Sedimentisphaerales bacterium]